MSKEKNKIIAEFMGAKFNGDFKNRDLYKFEAPPTQFASYNWDLEEMQYNLNWEWLMPVFEKINNLKIQYAPEIRITIFAVELFYRSNDGKPLFQNYKTTPLIESVFEAVAQFISWYNENQISQG